jgi:hypothetical protein
MSWRKIPFAVSLILSSQALHAAAAQVQTLPVTIPNLRPGFEFSITALALRPGASNLNYVIYNKELPTQSPSWTEKEIAPGFGAAFGLGARYIFPEGRDINLTWTHLNTNSSQSIAAPSAQFFLGPDYQIGPNGLPIRHAHGKSEFKYDVVNLDAGQFVDLGCHVETRFYAGLSNAYLREKVDATYTGNVDTGPFPGPFSTFQQVTANFTGLGPRVGMQGDYFLSHGFGLRANAAVSALIGYSYAKTSYTSSSQELQALFNQSSNYQTIIDKRIEHVVPGIDAKLGVFYKRDINNCTSFSLEAGYQAAVYVNAIQQYLPGTLVSEDTPLQSGGIFVGTMSHTQSNYSVQGPYLTAAVQF